MAEESTIRRRFRFIAAHLDERMRRLVAAAEAATLGFGGASIVARATGVSRRAIRIGLRELRQKPGALGLTGRIRRPGGGRKRTVLQDATLLRDLEALIDPATQTDPESPLHWTAKSVRQLAAELQRQGHRTSHRMVAEMLHELGYSLQANAKTIEGANYPDRNAQFEYMNEKVQRFLARGEPVISVETRKELLSDLKNMGRELRPQAQPEKERLPDLVIPELGRVISYGVYDLGINAGWVSVGVDHDTAEFAVETIRRWWRQMGQKSYPQAKRLLITADAQGSNGSRLRFWKPEIQNLADEMKIPIAICHFPPGTSKWNKIEHRLFSWISQNWRGKPLISHAVIVNLIAASGTQAGRKPRARIDTNSHSEGIKVSQAELENLRLRPDSFHGDWNYTILPHTIAASKG
jgi:transposase